MLPLSNGKSFLRLILIIHKSWDMQYFIHVLKISWTEATYIKVSRNSMLQPNLAFGRIQRKLHSQRFLLWNLHFRAPQHKSWPHGLAITSCSGRYFLVSYPISHLQITLAEVNPQWPSVPSGGQLVCLSWLLKSHLHSQFHLSTFFFMMFWNSQGLDLHDNYLYDCARGTNVPPVTVLIRTRLLGYE